MSTLEVVVGGQFGSEAKGHVVKRLTDRAKGTPQVIRVAGPNAGHTAYDASGTRWALRQVPIAAVCDGPAVLGISPGSEIDIDVLLSEYDALRGSGHFANKMLWVSGEATLITQHHKDTEIGLTHRIGSTGKGIGAARADRLLRKANRVVDDERVMEALAERGIAVAHHEHLPAVSSQHTIIEGTQGYGLGLHAGFYPQCTSSDCRASDFMAMAGVSPWEFDDVEVWVVARMFPIRVAGNSGPLKGETTWEALGLPQEHTTVTKKVRRVGMPDWELVASAVRANGGAPTCRLALTMVDQMFPFVADRHMWEPEILLSEENQSILTYFKEVERVTAAPVELVCTGPDTATFMRSVAD